MSQKQLKIRIKRLEGNHEEFWSVPGNRRLDHLRSFTRGCVYACIQIIGLKEDFRACHTGAPLQKLSGPCVRPCQPKSHFRGERREGFAFDMYRTGN